MRRLLLLQLFAFTAFACNATDTARINILFIGNSLTYTNNLPETVKDFGSQDSVLVTYTAHCSPNYSLEDHWNEGRVQAEIRSGKFDVVVAQQGPSALAESRALLIEYAGKLAALCHENKTRFCLFTVWPSKERGFDLDGVIASYRIAAEKTGSLLAQAGLAWKLFQEKKPETSLYGSDGFHPSAEGSALAAAVIYATLRGKKNTSYFSANPAVKSRFISAFILTATEVLIEVQKARF